MATSITTKRIIYKRKVLSLKEFKAKYPDPITKKRMAVNYIPRMLSIGVVRADETHDAIYGLGIDNQVYIWEGKAGWKLFE